MSILTTDKLSFEESINRKIDSEESIVLRYMRSVQFGSNPEEDRKYKDFLKQTSIREGVRIVSLLNYKGVEIFLMDETSLMHTKTLKSIDGAVSIAHCMLRGYDRVVFESGGNTGTAFTEYAQRCGLETFLFLPKNNISLLYSKSFEHDKSHLISVEDVELVKKGAHLFGNLKGATHIPDAVWRYQASMLRGFFILEYMLQNGKFDWITQAISAAFGPVGFYRVFREFKEEIGGFPRFMGIQQKANCPMYTAWKSNKKVPEPAKKGYNGQLLTRVMYDAEPYSYGSYDELVKILNDSRGDLTTIDHTEFGEFLAQDLNGKDILQPFSDNGIEITLHNGEVVEKTGLIALAGTLKEIDSGNIPEGSRVLCCLTSGTTRADGLARPDYVLKDLESMKREYIKQE
ncbi:pyridoxal-phosphate dependent enzyme [Thermodesulfobacteriota bacterium]